MGEVAIRGTSPTEERARAGRAGARDVGGTPAWAVPPTRRGKAPGRRAPPRRPRALAVIDQKNPRLLFTLCHQAPSASEQASGAKRTELTDLRSQRNYGAVGPQRRGHARVLTQAHSQMLLPLCLALCLSASAVAPAAPVMRRQVLAPTPSPTNEDNRPCYTSKSYPATYAFVYCASMSGAAGSVGCSSCLEPFSWGPQTADSSCSCNGVHGCDSVTYVNNASVSVKLYNRTGICLSPTSVFTNVSVSGACTAASSGAGYLAVTSFQPARAISNWCAVANSEASGQCKVCHPLKHMDVVITLSVVLPSVFIIVVVMWYWGRCCCPPPRNSPGGRRWARNAGAGPPGLVDPRLFPGSTQMVGFGNGSLGSIPPQMQGGVVHTAYVQAPGAMYAGPQLGGMQPGMQPGYAQQRATYVDK